MTLFSFSLVSITAVFNYRWAAIWFPLLFYMLSTIPFFLSVRNDPDWEFLRGHLLINNLLIFASFFVGYVFSKKATVLYVFPMVVTITKKSFRLSSFIFICAVILIFEVCGIVFFSKPNIVSSLLGQTAFHDRVYFSGYPFPFNFFWGNYYGIILLFVTFLFALLLGRNKTLPIFILFILFTLIYLSMLKKSSVLMLIAALGLYLYQSGLYKKKAYFALGLSLLIGGVAVLYFISVSYYPNDNIWQRLYQRLFFESFALTADFYRIFGHLLPSLNLIPSEGAGLFGFEGRKLEKEVFFEVFPNRINRYGNSPVLSYTYGSIALGKLVNLYLFVVYSLYFGAAIYLSKILDRNDVRTVAFYVTFSVFSMPLFLTGAFKNLSMFSVYPVSLILIFLGYKLLPRRIGVN